MKNLEDMINELPPELRDKVEGFVRKLIDANSAKTRKKPTFSWAGALSDLKGTYSSVDLQHKLLEWRIG
jgi:hypothetical protein